MSFSARIKKHVDDVRASYWFIPSLLVVSSVLLAFGAIWLDQHTDFSVMLPGWMTDQTSVEGARAVVSVIAQSTIGVAGVLFSITMLAVSFASGQYGPRLIGNFMRDQGNQWTLGILISTFTFALLVLRAIENQQENVDAFIPHFSIILSLILTFLSVFVMIFHVHHVPETISVSNIVAGLGRRFETGVDALLKNDTHAPVEGNASSVDVFMRVSGYIHNIADEKLGEIAQDHGWAIEILESPGAFVNPHRAVLRVSGTTDLDDKIAAKLRESVALGRAKTENQNIVFVVEQLVEIVARAMSPGINDPFTAMSCMHWMEAGLAKAAQQKGDWSVFQAKGKSAKAITFENLLACSLGNCRTYIQDDPLTRKCIFDVLERLGDLAFDVHRKPIVDLSDKVKNAN